MRNSIKLLLTTLIILTGILIGKEMYTRDLYEQHKLNKLAREDKRVARKSNQNDISANNFYTKAHMQKYIRLR